MKTTLYFFPARLKVELDFHKIRALFDISNFSNVHQFIVIRSFFCVITSEDRMDMLKISMFKCPRLFYNNRESALKFKSSRQEIF